MTIASDTSRASFTGNGSTTVFSFPYYFLANADLKVIKKLISTGAETTLTLDTNYTVSGAGVQAGGTVTTIGAGSPLSSAYKLIIYRDPARKQEMDLVENDPGPAETMERSFDRLTMIAQRLYNWVSRTMKLSEGMPDGVFDATLPVDIDLYPESVPITNAAGNGFKLAADWPNAGDIEDAEENAAAAQASADDSAASATASAASAAASEASSIVAQAAVDAVFWSDVVFKTFSDSPITVDSTYRAKYISVDASGGAVVINLPQISGLDLTSAFVIGIKKTDSSANAITINGYNAGDGTNEIDGAVNKTINAQNTGAVFVPDINPTPDGWTTADFGTAVDGSITLSKLAAQTTQPTDLFNYSLAASVAANALTIALKDAAGNNCTSSSPAKLSFRSVTDATGTRVVRSITGALSTVISSGSTAGHVDALFERLYIYAIDNAGAVELAWSSSNRWDENTRQSTTAEGGAGAADSKTVLYSTTARTNVAIRYIGRLLSAQATAGTWATAIAEVSSIPIKKPVSNSRARLYGDETIGVTNTKVQRFTTAVTVGTDLTIVQDVNLGDSITVNEDGFYCMYINSSDNVANVSHQIALDSVTLLGFADAGLVADYDSQVTSRVFSTSNTRFLTTGTIIRMLVDSATAANLMFEVNRVG